ncbi:MAG: RNA polymerase sigma factor [Phycisphaerales bacterium]|nr:MAG: RNA polymerase sigma factor [Phycisphaerales bacterium]UCG49238.1 MAG: RNA polymerase sigma factor [Phycisphaerales bacterium]
MKSKRRQNESALVCAAGRGDKQALRTLLVRNWDWLRALVYGVVCDAADVDDVLQDICVRVIGKIGTLREPERFRPWLAVVARNQALQYRRDKGHRPARLDEELAERQCDGRGAHFVDSMEQAEQCRLILEALRGLPAKYREVFVLGYTGDLTYAQIGEILDVPVTTVQIRLVRARRMIYDLVTGKDKVKER